MTKMLQSCCFLFWQVVGISLNTHTQTLGTGGGIVFPAIGEGKQVSLNYLAFGHPWAEVSQRFIN